ncbi:dual specificity phosphatase 29-like [Sycon ciliatum]|uniref:dual specificity phosphatase 29-like n=1 Tax=Sycon ciliatum TaxID=27933 RepID=UPI0031F67AA1
MRRRWQSAAALVLGRSRKRSGGATETDTSSAAVPTSKDEDVEPIPTMEVEERGDSFWSRMPVHADRVLPHIFIGNYSSGANRQFLAENNITYILNMTMEKHTNRFEGITYLNLGLDDHAGADISIFFKQAHDYLTTVRLEGAVALVHCHMGISRATTITMSHMLLGGKIYDDIDEHQENAKKFASRRAVDDKALRAAQVAPLTEQIALADVWKLVSSRRKCASPNDGFFRHLELLEMRLTNRNSPTVKRSNMWGSKFMQGR